MSSIYVLEPPTQGKVILTTTHGPIDIELWPKEAPKAVRNFVQLCLEGYYDNTIFHRIIKEFLIQGGDPTGTGSGGESIYGGPFSDEYHSRLRFNHRGIVACANAGSPHTNGSQFFISLDLCDWLNKKNTIFGKVTGDSIYNLSRLGELETDDNDRPIDPPPRIISVEVLWNPFDDIVPRVLASSLTQPVPDNDKKDSKKKAVKKLNLLSFGEEAEEDEKELAAVKQKIKSSHDVLDDPRLLKDELPKKDSSEAKKIRESIREALSSKKEEGKEVKKDSEARKSDSRDHSDDDYDVDFDNRMRQQIHRRREELGDHPSKPSKQLPPKTSKQKSHNAESSSPRDHESSRLRSNTGSARDEQSRVEKLSLKKKGIGSEVRSERVANGDADLQLLGEVERGRQLQKQKKRRLQGREDEVLARLEKFKSTISTKPDSSKNEAKGGNNEDLSDWGTVPLKFAPETGKDRMARREDVNDYVVHDPLLEKGKEKFNRMQAKLKRKEREWAGNSLT